MGGSDSWAMDPAVSTTSMPSTTSRTESWALASTPCSRATSSANAVARSRCRSNALTWRSGRTSRNASTCARAWSPQPSTPRLRAPRRARKRAESAEHAAVRRTVSHRPSITASGRPSEGSLRTRSAEMLG